MATVPSSEPDQTVGKEYLKSFALFEEVEDSDLEVLLGMSREITIPADELIMKEGEPGDYMVVILDGELEISKRQGESEVVLARRGKGEVIGEMALLSKAARSASVRSVGETRLLVINQMAFETLLRCGPEVPKAIVRTILSRLNDTQSTLVQAQKMASLGTLSAGLAHELNNPAAAVRRGVTHLREAIAEQGRAGAQLGALSLSREQQQALDDLNAELEGAASATRQGVADRYVDPLAYSDQEDAVQGWLEDRDIDRAWELAPTLVSNGWDEETLNRLAEDFLDEQLPAVISWLSASSSIYGLLDEIGKSADGISEIVKAVKSYSYLDQAPVQEIDVHESLESTLTILRHKLKQGIEVVRDYQELPRIEAYGSELNQVWTNLIDNAIDAMDGKGKITLRTRLEGKEVVVEIQDTGPGIPEDIQSRIFDAFYTTKPPGIGSGLGLHISYNILQKHHGRIALETRPGSTCFQVRLPLRLEHKGAS